VLSSASIFIAGHPPNAASSFKTVIGRGDYHRFPR
jgi:hypothetical protein